MYVPTSAAFRISSRFRRPMVAIAAAHDTGLPPKVLACAPGGHDITSARARQTPSGMPEAIPFAQATMSGCTP